MLALLVALAAADRPTLFLIGDSTVKTGTRGQQGWGDPVQALFDPARIAVQNHAAGGRSSRTFITEGRWDKVLAAAKPGDFVLVQMGHNDGGPLDDPQRARGSLRGTGEETREIDNPITKRKETVHTYGWYLRKYVADARAKGLTPVLLSPVPHCPKQAVRPGEVEANRYVGWAEEVATAGRVPFVHLNKLVLARYAESTPAEVKARYFTPADDTHTSPAGAALNAACVADGLRGLADCRLRDFLLPPAPRFSLGADRPGFTRVPRDTAYTPERGYGFEPGGGQFSVAVPEGNHAVTLTFGGPAGPTDTTVKAELRRLVVERVQTAAGDTQTRTVVVNVRTPAFPGGAVRLKAREQAEERWAWDDKLTLEFGGPKPGVVAVEVAAVAVPTVYLLGDSTVCDQPREPYASWGQMLPRFIAPTAAVANHAESGESVAGARAARRFDKVLAGVRPGDFVLAQFGHNDMKAVTAAAYRTDLGRLVADVRATGGTMVLVTPVHRRTFAGGTVRNSLGDFPDAVRELAAAGKVPLIDLHAASKTLYEALGPDGSGALFKPGDGTHHTNYGAYELARCVVEGVRANVPALVRHLAADAGRFDPAHPDPAAGFTLPASPSPPAAPPDGK